MSSFKKFTKESIIRWGILSAGEISSDWAKSFKAMTSNKEHELIGIAARNPESAKKFATTFNIPKYYKSYEELCKDPEIDVVYIGSIHPVHLSLGKLALDNGKHVLCEKPLCVNTKETEELIQYAKTKHLFLMEAIWSRFFPAYYKVREELEKGTIGEVLQVIAGMGIQFREGNWRETNLAECAGGAALDIGTYTCQIASLAFGGDKPIKILALGNTNEVGIDDRSSATILYSRGRIAALQLHMKVNFPNDAYIIGTKGTIKICNPFWSPTKIETPSGTYEYPLPKIDGKMYFWNSEGLAYQCTEVRQCLIEGKLESSLMSHQESIVLAQMREDIRKQLGVFYPQDKIGDTYPFQCQ